MTTTVTDTPVPKVRRDTIQPGEGFLGNWQDFDAGFVNIAVNDGSHVQLPGGYRGEMAGETMVYRADVNIDVSHP